jgi:hypothetical protein
VGDYTWRLASELTKRGHSCSLLALADFHVQEATYGERPVPANQTGETFNGISYARLAAMDSWRSRLIGAKEFVAKAAPDWISWQFVLYGFDPKGIGFGLGKRLREIATGYKNEIMFHEIWIGEARQSTLKNKVIGSFQKRAIRDVLQKIRPLLVHTHVPLYQYLLGKLGRGVTRLPLFGNIPVAARGAELLSENWHEEWYELITADRQSWWIFLMFGSLHPEWDADEFLRRVSTAAQEAGKKCALVSIGRQGAAGEHKWQLLEQRKIAAWKFLNLGPQPEERISQCLLAADFGVSAMPPEYLFKSGTAAAMVEHGLHVIATRPRYDYPGCPEDILAAQMRNVVTDFEPASMHKTKVGSLLPKVASQFVEDLQEAESVPLTA